MEDYYYRLQYRDKDTVVTHEFPAELDGTEMTFHLRDFLCGCSWSEKQANSILGIIGEDE